MAAAAAAVGKKCERRILSLRAEKCEELSCQGKTSAGTSEMFMLDDWRKLDLNHNRKWGKSNIAVPVAESSYGRSPLVEEISLRITDEVVNYRIMELVALALGECQPVRKAELTHAAWTLAHSYIRKKDVDRCSLSDAFANRKAYVPRAGRPAKPELVPPREVPKVGSKEALPLNIHLLHSVCHIEFNAINLALDTALRFAPTIIGEKDLNPVDSINDLRVPDLFVQDFLKVADDESRHFLWCLQRLEECGYQYGSMVAHDLLWDGAEQTRGNVLDRVVVVPCVQEARGLDAGPRIATRLVGFGDNRSASIIKQIAKEEIAHVAVGTYWLGRLCNGNKSKIEIQFKSAIQRHCPNILKGPFDHKSREFAGLQRSWYEDESAHSNIKILKPEKPTLLRQRLELMRGTEQEMSECV